MQHHHIDEFSVTDIRHTLHEVWRVVSARRWFFLLPMCAVSTVAFLCVFMIPRVYRASTVIKREHDAVFEAIGDEQWTRPYQQIPARIDEQIRSPEFLEGVLASLGLPRATEPLADGSLMPPDAAARRALAEKVAAGLSTSTVGSTGNREVVEISLKMDDPTHMVTLLRAVRDQYLLQARTMTVEVMEDVKDFLQAESARCQEELDRARERVVAYELKYPGINPNAPDPSEAERSALLIERVEVQRQLEDLALERERTETRLARLAGLGAAGEAAEEERLVAEPNPRHAELVAEIGRLRREIADGRMLRGMTDAHPKIRNARRKLEARQAELEETPAVVMVSASSRIEPAGGQAAAEKLKRRLEDNKVSAAAMTARLRTLRKRLDEIAQQRALAMQHRQAYLKASAEADEWVKRLSAWRKHIAPIRDALYLEDQDRSVHLETVREVNTVGKPVAPDAMFVMVLCVGVGLAAAVLTVLVAELIDRSYRTAKQLSTSLGIPVIESIDEIMTAAMHRRRFIRRLVVLPALGLSFLSATVFTGTMAYLHLEESVDGTVPAASNRVVEELLAEGRASASVSTQTGEPWVESRKH